ncbi:dihydrodipicolinate synthase family protein [Nonomuraea sp. NPDC050680]|uniref:dihydrodipicolinate synthase family protein n=1 Tax=Nonomuraea sp. NPDC050680 TaxID=3154630 RepID=UPI0033CC375C
MDISAQVLRDRLRGTLLAAAATPMTESGEVDLGVVSRYLAGLVEDGADGLAVLAHTGRGPYLTPDVRAAVIERAVALGVPVIVGIGGSPEQSRGVAGSPEQTGGVAGSPEQTGGFAQAEEQARVAARLGADGVLVFPAEGDRLGGHEAIWQAAGIPMIAFDLYTRPCPPETMRDLLRHPGVAGIKTALLSDAMGCQRAITLARQAGRLAITGEDRMFGPSLLWGAEAALVGLAAASVSVTAAVMAAYRGSDLRAFDAASGRLDRLATATFTEPMEGYVQRMLWLAAAEGRIPESHAHDPYGPSLPEQERAAVARAAGYLAT